MKARLDAKIAGINQRGAKLKEERAALAKSQVLHPIDPQPSTLQTLRSKPSAHHTSTLILGLAQDQRREVRVLVSPSLDPKPKTLNPKP